MKLMNRIVITVMIIGLNNLAQAKGVAYKATVVDVRIDHTGHGFIKFKEPLKDAHNSSIPDCTQEAYSNMLAFDVNTAGGKAVMAIALAAKSSGKLIHGVGAGKCDVYGVMEDWSYGWIQ
jgi:hypothetical protein